MSRRRRSLTADPGPAIEAVSLRRTFRRGGVRDLTLTVPSGTIFGFIGPSGSGKTTAVRLLTGAYRADGGDATILGRSPWHLTAADRRRIGYLPQRNVLYPRLTIEGNVRFAAALYGMAFRRRRVGEVLRLVDLHEHRSTKLGDASGGMQRRAALAAAVVHDPELLFLDEPTAGLDPILRARLWDHFAQLRDEGRTVFVTTQIESEAAHCDLVALMLDGEVVLTETPDELRRIALGGDVLRIRGSEPVPQAALAALHALAERGAVRQVRTSPADACIVDVVVEDPVLAHPAVEGAIAPHFAAAPLIERHLPPFDEVFVALVRGAASSVGGGGEVEERS